MLHFAVFLKLNVSSQLLLHYCINVLCASPVASVDLQTIEWIIVFEIKRSGSCFNVDKQTNKQIFPKYDSRLKMNKQTNKKRCIITTMCSNFIFSVVSPSVVKKMM